jgi:hypothetical protein
VHVIALRCVLRTALGFFCLFLFFSHTLTRTPVRVLELFRPFMAVVPEISKPLKPVSELQRVCDATP